MTDRGVIEHRARAQQIRDFSGLRYGNITPTDIDGLIEYQNIAYVIIETKFGDAELPKGQNLALERIGDALGKHKHVIVIISTHNHPIEEDIDLAKTIVKRVRWHCKWIDMNKSHTVREVIDRFINSIKQKSSVQ